MKRKRWVFLIILGAILFSQLSCGRKAPPFIPKERIQMRVTRLKGEWKKDSVVLKGRVAVHQGQEKAISDIIGCRVYHIRHPLDNPPCEGCPIRYKVYTELKGDFIKGDRFRCQVQKEKKKGVHFFEVRLIGREGTSGPSSNRVKLTVGE